MNSNQEITFSKHVPESRPFDFLYDSICTISEEKQFYKLAADALQKTSEKDIRPCYDSMFSDVNRYPRNQIVYKTERIPLSWEERSKKLETYEPVSGRNMIKYVARSHSDAVTKFRLEELQKKTAPRVCINEISEEIGAKMDDLKQSYSFKRRQMCTKGTQTDYRDSETQTDLWIPPYITNGGRMSKILLLKPENEIPTVYDVDAFEEKNKINDLEQKLLSTSKRNLRAQIAITKQIERIEWMVKEKRIDYINETRIELAQTILYKHTLETNVTIAKREESFKNLQNELKHVKLQALFKKKEREMRKLTEKSQKRQYTWMMLAHCEY